MKVTSVRRDGSSQVGTDNRRRENMSKTLKEAAEELVAKSAEIIRMRTFATPQYLRPHEQRLALWDTPQGKELRAAVKAYGQLPVEEVTKTVYKAKADPVLKAGYQVLSKGFPQIHG